MTQGFDSLYRVCSTYKTVVWERESARWETLVLRCAALAEGAYGVWRPKGWDNLIAGNWWAGALTLSTVTLTPSSHNNNNNNTMRAGGRFTTWQMINGQRIRNAAAAAAAAHKVTGQSWLDKSGNGTGKHDSSSGSSGCSRSTDSTYQTFVRPVTVSRLSGYYAFQKHLVAPTSSLRVNW